MAATANVCLFLPAALFRFFVDVLSISLMQVWRIDGRRRCWTCRQTWRKGRTCALLFCNLQRSATQQPSFVRAHRLRLTFLAQAKYSCPVCKQQAPDLKSMEQHHESKASARVVGCGAAAADTRSSMPSSALLTQKRASICMKCTGEQLKVCGVRHGSRAAPPLRLLSPLQS